VALLVYIRAGAVTLRRPISDYYVAGRLVPAMLNGMAIAASFVAVLVFVWLAGGSGLEAKESALLMFGAAGGLLAGGLMFGPYLRKFGGYTIPDFLGERFGAGMGVRPLAVLAVILCSFPALALALLSLGLVATRIFPVDLELGILGAVAMLFFCVLAGGMRAASLNQIVQYGALLAVSFAAFGILWWKEVATYSVAVPSVPGQPWYGLKLEVLAAGDPINVVALIVCVAAGIASLPHLLGRALTTTSIDEARASYRWAIGLVAMLCLAAPAYLSLYASSQGPEAGRAAVVVEGLVATGAIAALLAIASGLVLAIANTLSYDVYYKNLHPTAPAEQLLLAARAMVILVAGLAAGLAVLAPQATIDVTGAAFSLAASIFLPALLLGLWWKRASGEGALAGMLAGLGVCLFYMLVPRYFPFAFYETSSFLSDATPEQAAGYAALRQSYYLAEPAGREAALAAWEGSARTVANWWGVRPVFAGLFAVPVGFAAMIAVSLFTPAPSRDTQDFVEELRKPAG
jgi:cation/acetate symporter